MTITLPPAFRHGLLALILLIGGAGAAVAMDRYVRPDGGSYGSGNGSDWTNAYPGFSGIAWSAIAPGDTIWIAGGLYGPLTIDRSGTAGSPITCKRATAAVHGAGAGWSASYDARVVIDGGRGLSAVSTDGSYTSHDFITVDGATRYGIWARNAYYGVRAAYGTSNLTLRNLEIGDAGAYRLDEDGIQGKGDALVVEQCYIHDNDSHVTHGDGIQWFGGDRVTIRYNIWKNNGQEIYLGEASWSTVVNDVDISYNVIYNRGGGHYNGIVIYGNATQSGRYINVCNNTIDLEATDNSGYNSVFYPLTGTATKTFRNNAVIASNANQVPNTTHGNNAYDDAGASVVYYIPTETARVTAADLGFVDAAPATGTPDYHLTATSPLIGKGANLGLARDFDGRPVPATPSIGAFEFAGSTAPLPDTTPPLVALIAPTAGATIAGTVTISVTATDNVGVAGVQFKLDGANLAAEDTAAPYAISWNTTTASAGPHVLTAVARDAAGNFATAATVTVTVGNQAPAASGSLFTTQVPALPHNDDGVDYELGMRFQSTNAGLITAIRFWKDSAESGTHVGRIWSAGGVQLASVTFVGEGASGWQLQALATPLNIVAGSEYLVSVNTGGHGYVATNNGLASQIANGPLRSVVGTNGRFGPPGQYPTQSWQASNYFRDVVFAPAATTPAANATVTISCDNAYDLYVNGVLTGSGGNWNAAQSYSVPQLAGRNVVAVKARDLGGAAALLAELRIGVLRLGTGTGWKVSTTAPAGWETLGFDDRGWTGASDFGAYGVAPWNRSVSGMPLDTPAHWIWSSDNQATDTVYLRFAYDQAGTGAPLTTTVSTAESTAAAGGTSCGLGSGIGLIAGLGLVLGRRRR